MTRRCGFSGERWRRCTARLSADPRTPGIKIPACWALCRQVFRRVAAYKNVRVTRVRNLRAANCGLRVIDKASGGNSMGGGAGARLGSAQNDETWDEDQHYDREGAIDVVK